MLEQLGNVSREIRKPQRKGWTLENTLNEFISRLNVTECGISELKIYQYNSKRGKKIQNSQKPWDDYK